MEESDTKSELLPDSEAGISRCEGYSRLIVGTTIHFLLHMPYFAMAGVLTSFNGLIGFVALGSMWLCWCVSQFVSSVTLKLIGMKCSFILTSILYTLFTLGNFYPTWLTLIGGSALMGVGGGIIWTAVLSYVTDAAKKMCLTTGKDARYVISRFHGIVHLGYCGSALIGSLISSAFLLPSQLLSIATFNSSNITELNETRFCDVETSFETTPEWATFGVLAVGLLSSITALLLSFCIKGSASLCYQPWSYYYISENKRKRKKSFLKTYLRVTFHPRYNFAFLISFLSGLNQGFFFGKFSKYFVSECIGVGYVGLAVLTWGLSSSLTSVLTGRISTISTRTLLAIPVALCQVALYLFLLLWPREPSHAVVFVASFLAGITDGLWMTLSSIYIGIVAKSSEKEVAFSLIKGVLAVGGSISFFVFGNINITENIIVLLSVLLVSVVLYISAEIIFGKDCARRTKTVKVDN